MPTDSVEKIMVFNDCLNEIVTVIESYGIELVYTSGDFNAHPDELFGKELFNFGVD